MPEFEPIKFGFADARTERERNAELLLSGFLDDGNLMDEALQGHRFLFLGYKGSGKTAIVERAKLLAGPDLFVTSATLKQFSYADFQLVAGGTGEARFPRAWATSLLLLMLQSFAEDEGARVTEQPEYADVVSGLHQLGLMPTPRLGQKVSKTEKRSVKVGLPRVVEVMAEQVKEGRDLQLAQLDRVLREAAASFRTDNRHIVLVDGLDEVQTERQVQLEAIAAMLTEVAELNSELQAAHVPAKFVVVCRTDIFNRLPGANMTKFRRDHSVALDWYDDPQDPGASRLNRLVDLRASLALGREVRVFDELLPDRIDGRHSIRYLFDHTRHTPRDVVELMNELQLPPTGERIAPNQIKNSGLRRYSNDYFISELRDELNGHLKAEEIPKVIPLLTNLGSDRFTLDSLRERAERLKLGELDLNNLVETWFECGGLGMLDDRPGRGRLYTFKFRNRNAAPDLSSKWVIHLGAHKALNIER